MERGVAGVMADGAMRDVPQIEPLAIPVYAGGAAAPPSFGIHHAVDLNQPIACGDVAVFPGDVLVGDAEGVVVVPLHLADEVARDAAEQEQLESWILKEVKAGKGIFGLYPPDDETRAATRLGATAMHERTHETLASCRSSLSLKDRLSRNRLVAGRGGEHGLRRSEKPSSTAGHLTNRRSLVRFRSV